MSKTDAPLEKALAEVESEVFFARNKFSPFNSAHEGFAVLKEEVDELWEEVRKPSKSRAADDLSRMRKEAKQVAAMAIRFMLDVTP